MGVFVKELVVIGNGNYMEDFFELVFQMMCFYYIYEVLCMIGMLEVIMNEEELILMKEKVWLV